MHFICTVIVAGGN